jgi:hypothetical protein
VRERERLTEERMGTLFAPDYDAHWESRSSPHETMLHRFLSLCFYRKARSWMRPAGRFWLTILENGCSVSVRARVATHA